MKSLLEPFIELMNKKIETEDYEILSLEKRVGYAVPDYYCTATVRFEDVVFKFHVGKYSTAFGLGMDSDLVIFSIKEENRKLLASKIAKEFRKKYDEKK